MLILLFTLACTTSTPADEMSHEGTEAHGDHMEHVTKSEEHAMKSEEHAEMDKATYVCPMHPEIISDKPGSCSECGMDLEKKDAEGAHTEHDH